MTRDVEMQECLEEMWYAASKIGFFQRIENPYLSITWDAFVFGFTDYEN